MSVKFYMPRCFFVILTSLALGSTTSAEDLLVIQDKNADGVLSGLEAKFFTPFDTDRDGEITKQEFDAGVARHLNRVNAQDRSIFEARDGNHDGRLSGTEISGYEFTDVDGDGRIPESEFLDGMLRYRRKLTSMTFEELATEASRRFKLLDLNEDNRLSGTEALDMSSYDLNDDRRITLEEFHLGLLLDSALSNESPDLLTSDPIKTIVDAINQKDVQTLYGTLRPELKEKVDEVVLGYLMRQVANSHGRLSIPAEAGIEIKDGEQRGTRVYSAKPACENGQLSVRLLMLKGGVLGLALESPEVDRLNDKMFGDLLEDSTGDLERFGKFYAPACEKMIRHIFANEDRLAIGQFHPEIQQKVGLGPFGEIFEKLRNACGELSKIELETAGVELGTNGKGKFFTLSHRVTGSKSVMLISHRMQFVGLKAYFVAASIEPDKPKAELPAAGKPLTAAKPSTTASQPSVATPSISKIGDSLASPEPTKAK